MRTLITHLVAFVFGGSAGWWISRRGIAAMAVEVKQAAADVKKKL